ncbi:MAG: hypothetical protein ACRC8A_10030 [Microcoleaceae cyanobacterium]
MTSNKQNLDLLFDSIAEGGARIAYEEEFQCRMGVFPLAFNDTGAHVSIVFNNNPNPKRPLLLEQVKNYLGDAGMFVIAEARYPLEGRVKDYSVAMVIMAPVNFVQPIVERAVGAFYNH